MHLSALWGLFTERNDTLCYPRGGGGGTLATAFDLASFRLSMIAPCLRPSHYVPEGKIGFAKHLAHDGSSCCCSRRIWYVKWNIFHLTSIIPHSRSSTIPFLTYMSLCFPVQNIRVSLVNEISFAKWVFGAGKCTTSPLSLSNRSCHSNATYNL